MAPAVRGINPAKTYTKNNEQHLNNMKCPVCNEPDLVMTERQGVEIDYCPKCRGVWLDRGELDKIIERSTSGPSEVPISQTPASGYSGHDDRARYHGRNGHDDHHGHYRKRSWLGELFD